MTTAARARRYDALLAEHQQDERRDLEARGLISPHQDGSPKTVVQNLGISGERRARCSCGFEGTTTTDYATALRERNAHARSHK